MLASKDLPVQSEDDQRFNNRINCFFYCLVYIVLCLLRPWLFLISRSCLIHPSGLTSVQKVEEQQQHHMNVTILNERTIINIAIISS